MRSSDCSAFTMTMAMACFAVTTPACSTSPAETAATGGATAANSAATGGLGAASASGGSGASSSSRSPEQGGATASSEATAGSGNFVLAWQDDFDTFNSSLWALQTFSWDGNLAQFTAANATVDNGVVTIHLTPEPSDSQKPYRGVEMRSTKTVKYGKVEAKIRFAKGSGVVSGLVAIYTPWPADDWNEIDFEHLGNKPQSLQTSCQVYTGPATTKPVSTSVTPSRFEQMVALGFDAEADFHVYSAEWTPAEVKFLIDGQLVRSWKDEIDRMKLPQNILFTIWASNSSGWAGPINDTTAPTDAAMDWIKVYDYR